MSGLTYKGRMISIKMGCTNCFKLYYTYIRQLQTSFFGTPVLFNIKPIFTMQELTLRNYRKA